MTNSSPQSSGPSAPSAGQPASTADLEARIAALSALLKSTLTTLMLRGLLNRAEIAPLVAEAEKLMSSSSPAAAAELASVATDLPQYLREAMGPAPDDDDHDH